MKNKNLLLIFTRNPELGKVKSRLAKSIGDKKALIIYKELLKHTKNITIHLTVEKWVFYSEIIEGIDLWDKNHYYKKIQFGTDLGMRMKHAFEVGFKAGFNKIIIIGSDIYDLQQKHIEEAFAILETHKTVIGPAEDGGYYLLGKKELIPEIFENKAWGTDSILKETLENLEGKHSNYLLETLNDIDVISDIKSDSYLEKYL